jgi:peptidoglycan/xylan/chitin deacetylase (PgdA/CDA1 family)
MGQVSHAGQRWPRLERAVEEASIRPARGKWRRRLVDWGAQRQPQPVFPPGIYVFTFHSVIDPSRAEPWERAYAKVAISTDEFRTTLRFLSAQFTPLRLAEALAFEGRLVDRPYAVITFDDGYRNTLTEAAPIATECGFTPAVFVNGAFAEGGVYYRVLAALLTAVADEPPGAALESGARAKVLREELRARVPVVAWSAHPATLFDQTKDAYVRGAVEEASDAAYRRAGGDPAALRVHLTADQVRALVGRGWDIANHTFAHDQLSDLDAHAVADTVERNERYWGARDVPLLPCMAYPNGAAKHVGPGVVEYLAGRQDLHGMFCSGGINRRPQRTEWLRIAVSPRFASGLQRSIADEIARTDAATSVAERAAS